MATMEFNQPVHHGGQNAGDAALLHLARSVRRMRGLQNRYFRTPKSELNERQNALKAAKSAESYVDKLVDKIINGIVD